MDMTSLSLFLLRLVIFSVSFLGDSGAKVLQIQPTAFPVENAPIK